MPDKLDAIERRINQFDSNYPTPITKEEVKWLLTRLKAAEAVCEKAIALVKQCVTVTGHPKTCRGEQPTMLPCDCPISMTQDALSIWEAARG